MEYSYHILTTRPKTLKKVSSFGSVLLREQLFNLWFTKKDTQKDYWTLMYFLHVTFYLINFFDFVRGCVFRPALVCCSSNTCCVFWSAFGCCSSYTLISYHDTGTYLVLSRRANHWAMKTWLIYLKTPTWGAKAWHFQSSIKYHLLENNKLIFFKIKVKFPFIQYML